MNGATRKSALRVKGFSLRQRDYGSAIAAFGFKGVSLTGGLAIFEPPCRQSEIANLAYVGRFTLGATSSTPQTFHRRNKITPRLVTAP
jgi:hypothetical protein